MILQIGKKYKSIIVCAISYQIGHKFTSAHTAGCSEQSDTNVFLFARWCLTGLVLRVARLYDSCTN